MELGARHGAVLARVLVAVLLVLAATACGTEQQQQQQAASLPRPSASVEPPDPGIEVTGLPVGVAFGVSDTSVGVENGASLDFVSPVFSVEPAGALDDPVTVRVELDNAVPASTPVLVASRTSDKAPWAFQAARLSSDLRHAEFQTRNLNQLGVLSLSVDAALASFHADVRSGLASGVDKAVDPPACGLRLAARETGYSVVSSQGRSVHWCLGLEHDKRVLKVRNRLLSPIQIAHAGVPAIVTPGIPAAYAPWTGILGTTGTFLAPGRTATYDLDLEPLTGLTVIADAGATVQSLRLLQATVRAIARQLTGFDAGPTDVTATVRSLLARPRCRTSLGKGSAPLLAGCFSRDGLIRTFGSRALLVSPLLTAPSTPALFRAEEQAMAGARLTDQQRIDVARAAPDFSTFAGFWTGRDRLLTINGQGVVSETVNQGPVPVVRLAYQLTEPVAKNGVSTATAKITGVSVGDRKLLKGRVPHVGDQGTVTLRAGVVQPPFLTTSYCSAARAKKGGCGS